MEPLSRPFLTNADPQAAVKGSRDPLGIQSIWTRLGRHVVGNLSTVSNSVRDFAVLILGYHFAERVAEAQEPGTELGTFLKWEQLAAYVRAGVHRETGFRGIERARQNLDENAVVLSADVRHQILSSQKLYGIWGLYSVPARSSGILDGDPARLTVPARELVEAVYLPRLTQSGFKGGKPIVDLLARRQVRLDPEGRDRALLRAVAGVLGDRLLARERTFFREHLLHGGPGDSTDGRQRQLAELLEPKLREPAFPWSPSGVRALAKEAEQRGTEWHALAGFLRRIAAAETLLAPASALFIHLLGCHGMRVEELTRRLRQTWGTAVSTVAVDALPALQGELGGSDPEAGSRWVEAGKAMSAGAYPELVRLLLDQNRSVVAGRGGAAAWIEIQGQRFHVRMREERGGLPSRRELRDLWRSPYFLDSLCSVAFTLKEAARG